MKIQFIFNDGGREEAGFSGITGDCAARALAIAAQIPYIDAYNLINQAAQGERCGKRKRGISNARTGVYGATIRRLMAKLGWQWVSCMGIGTGCKVHLRAEELPPGRLICVVSKHYCAVIDGVLHDLYDCSREGTRCVYGYFIKK